MPILVEGKEFFAKGFSLFYFLVTPTEMRMVLDGLHHVITNRRVPKNYVQSDPEELFSQYADYYEQLKTGRKLQWKQDWALFGFSKSFVETLDYIGYGEPFERDGGVWKLPAFRCPSPGLDPFSLLLREDGKLYLRYSYTQFPQFAAGVCLFYPKAFYQKRDNGEYSELIPASKAGIPSYADYDLIVQRVKKLCSKIQFYSQGKLYRPQIWVSEEAKQDFSQFYFFKENKCCF